MSSRGRNGNHFHNFGIKNCVGFHDFFIKTACIQWQCHEGLEGACPPKAQNLTKIVKENVVTQQRRFLSPCLRTLTAPRSRKQHTFDPYYTFGF